MDRSNLLEWKSNVRAMTEAYIGFGGNVGDAATSIRTAFDLLGKSEKVVSARLSPIYRSAPVGYVEQDWFYNAVAKLDVACSCHELLDLCLGIERQMKRVREVRWGPRIIDLDVLIFGNECIEEDALVVPHPRAHERAFVLAPLCDLDSSISLRGTLASEWLERVEDQKIEKCKV